MQKAIRNQKGFTLIELIVVVAILGILAVVLTPKLLSAIDNSRVNAAMTSAQEIQTAMDRYLVDNKSYPAGADVTVLYGAGAGSLEPYVNLSATPSTFTWGAYQAYTKPDNATGCAAVPCGGYALTIKANDTAATVITITPANVSHP